MAMVALPAFNGAGVSTATNAAMEQAAYAESGQMVDEAAVPALAGLAYLAAPAAAYAVSYSWTIGSFGSAVTEGVSNAWNGRIWGPGSDYGIHTNADGTISSDVLFDR